MQWMITTAIVRSCLPDHLTFKLGCTRDHARSPIGLSLTRPVTPLQTPGLRRTPCLSTCRRSQWPGLGAEAGSACFYYVIPPLCVGPLAGGVAPNKQGIVKIHKCVWVTPFRDNPLLMTVQKMQGCSDKEARGHVQGATPRWHSCSYSDEEQEQTLKRRSERNVWWEVTPCLVGHHNDFSFYIQWNEKKLL